MTTRRFLLALLLVSASAAVAVSARQDSAVEITARDAKIAARLVLPQGTTGKVPVVLFVSAADEVTNGGIRAFADVLAKEGIASLRFDRPLATSAAEGTPEFESAVAGIAAGVSFLRNDVRFSTITVAGDQAGTATATVAARIARADTFAALSLDSPPALTKVVRDLDLPSAPKPRRNPGQRASLRDTTIATVDGARIGIEYGRPSKRNRLIWGNLVKWGGWWMPGADEATTLTTTRPLTLGSLIVPEGDYTLYTAPGDTEFTLIVNRETGQFHTVYHPERDLGRVAMTKETADPATERLTFVIEPRPGGGGALKLIWDDRAYVVPFTVNR